MTSSDSHNKPVGRGSYSHFKDQETEVKELAKDRNGTGSKLCPTLSPMLSLLGDSAPGSSSVLLAGEGGLK